MYITRLMFSVPVHPFSSEDASYSFPFPHPPVINVIAASALVYASVRR
jgi:hypothetical protein